MSILVALISSLGFFLGLILYVGAPWILAPYLPTRYQNTLARLYLKQSQVASQRTLPVIRINPGVELSPSTFDVEKGDGEKITLDGEERHFEDTASKIRYLYNKPFGFALEKTSVIVDPVISAIGELQNNLIEQNQLTVDDSEINELDVQEDTGMIDHVKLPETPYCVRLEEAIRIIGGGLDPSAVDVTWEYGKKSQDPFKGKPAFEIFTIVGIFIAVLGVIWLAFSFADGGSSSGGSSGDPIPIMIRSIGWWL